MRRGIALLIIVMLLIVIMIAAIFINNNASNTETQEKPFHVGVTFGGNNSADAKILIDRVKDYTNMLVVNSGSMQNNITELETTCDYAVNSGLDVIIYFGSYEHQSQATAPFIETARERWGSHFLGVYYGDEPGGKMLDGDSDTKVDLGYIPNIGNVSKYGGRVVISQTNGSVETAKTFYFSGGVDVSNSATNIFTSYSPDGTIRVGNFTDYENPETLVYFPNGTVTQQKGFSNPPIIVTDRGDISQFETCQETWASYPFQTTKDAPTIAAAFVNARQTETSWLHNQFNVSILTSDYALYWWDYLGGYDTVFAQLGWNNSAAQEIGLVRGAANLQGKNWGTIITWTYTQQPYLTSGEEMFNQMRLSYECGAEHVIIFSYAEDMNGPYGTLQDEHFQALQRFWNDVVHNPNVKHGGVKAEEVLVLPKDYGWGMRRPQDKIWGLWSVDSISPQVWTQFQNCLQQYGSKLDVVYDDPLFPVAGKYSHIYYWNQTG